MSLESYSRNPFLPSPSVPPPRPQKGGAGWGAGSLRTIGPFLGPGTAAPAPRSLGLRPPRRPEAPRQMGRPPPFRPGPLPSSLLRGLAWDAGAERRGDSSRAWQVAVLSETPRDSIPPPDPGLSRLLLGPGTGRRAGGGKETNSGPADRLEWGPGHVASPDRASREARGCQVAPASGASGP